MGPGVSGGPTAAAVVAASEGKAKKYGLLGLLGVIRMTDPDLNMLALGSDLTTVGLNLDSADVSAGGGGAIDAKRGETGEKVRSIMTIRRQYVFIFCLFLKAFRFIFV